MAGPELTPDTTGNPFVEVFFDPADLDPAAASIRMLRLSEDRSWLVRGGVDVAPGVAALDFECPFKTEATYRAEMFDESGVSLGFTDSTSTELDFTGTVIHQPLQPMLWAPVTLRRTSDGPLVRPVPGELVAVEGSSVGRWIGSNRRGLQNVPLSVRAESLADADRLQAVLGTYVTQQVGVVCIRSSSKIRWPRTFFASVPDLSEQGLTVHTGGGRVEFDAVVSEAQPPFPGLVVPLLTYDDLDAFGDYAAQDANWATYTDRDRAYELAGLANQP